MREEACDVVIVGSGGAGLAAALEAARAGARTLVVEKQAIIGGTTAMSVGSITASATSLQRRKGIADTAQDHFDDMGLYEAPSGAVDHLRLRRLLTERSAETVDWLTSLGLTFYGPSLEPPHRRARMHNVLFNGRAYVEVLVRHCRKAGVRFLLDTAVERLVHENGRVSGIEARDAQGPLRIKAGAVVLATGDTTNAPDFRKQFLPAGADAVGAHHAGSTGDGHRMAMALGVKVLNAGLYSGSELRFPPPTKQSFIARLPAWRGLTRLVRFMMERLPRAVLRPFAVVYMTGRLAPSFKLLENGAILVDAKGARIKAPRGEEPIAVARTQGGKGFIVFDDAVAKRFAAWPYFISTAPGIAYAYLPDYQRHRPDVCHQAETIAGLARKLGMPAETLTASVDSARREAPGTLATPPFHALGPVPSWLLITEGSLDINEELAILGPDEQPIEGLFGAGSVGQGGLLLPWHGHHLSWAFTSGRIAGRNAARAARPPQA